MSEEEEIDLSGLSFADDVVTAGDALVSWLKVLAYGASGGGKSSLMATMPDPLLVLLTEKQGEMSIKRVNPRAKIVYIEDKIVCRCHQGNPKKCPDGAKKGTEKLTAKEVLYGVIDELATKKHPFVSVALDSLTDLQQILLKDMKGGKPGAKVSLPEWGSLIDETKHIVIKLRNLNMHVGVICLSNEVQDNNQRLIQRPALAGKKLPGDVIQYFNLCCFQRKMRDQNATGHAIYESVFDAGDEYYTKTHPALAPIEPPLFRHWVDKVAKHAQDNGEGDMPTASSPVSNVVNEHRKANTFKDRIEKPKIKALFDKLGSPEAARLAGAEKYRSDDKLIEILEKRIAEQEAKKEQEATEARRKEARDQKGEKVNPEPSTPPAPQEVAPS